MQHRGLFEWTPFAKAAMSSVMALFGTACTPSTDAVPSARSSIVVGTWRAVLEAPPWSALSRTTSREEAQNVEAVWQNAASDAELNGSTMPDFVFRPDGTGELAAGFAGVQLKDEFTWRVAAESEGLISLEIRKPIARAPVEVMTFRIESNASMVISGGAMSGARLKRLQ